MKAIGYGFWGYLSDRKLLPDGSVAKTPDGNAFYSWSVLETLLKIAEDYSINHGEAVNVFRLFPQRDVELFFDTFEKEQREEAYNKTVTVYYPDFKKYASYGKFYEDVHDMIQNIVNGFYFVILENRFLIEGRNDHGTFYYDRENFQPDKVIFDCWVKVCAERNVPCIILDLDYKIDSNTYNEIINQKSLGYMELGNMNLHFLQEKGVVCGTTTLPFNATTKRFLKSKRERGSYEVHLSYIGNRYERDEFVDKYFAENVFEKGKYKINFYGNWIEPKYNSCIEKWPLINFNGRVCAEDFPRIYGESLCTLILAKDVYFKYDFVTTRIIESIYFGCIPLMPVEYSERVRRKYLGSYTDFLTIKNAKDLRFTIDALSSFQKNEYFKILNYLFDRVMSIASISIFKKKLTQMVEDLNYKIKEKK